jgi:hypothetical protein
MVHLSFEFRVHAGAFAVYPAGVSVNRLIPPFKPRRILK